MAAKIVKDAVIAISLDEIPLPSVYGAAEMKFFIRKNTYRGAIITLIVLLLLLLVNFVVDTVQSSAKVQLTAPITKMSLEDLPPPDADVADIPPPPDVVINTGPAARAGNPIPVPDAMIAPDIKDFATEDIMSRTSAVGGDGNDMGDFSANINWGTNEVKEVTKLEDEPGIDDFIPVEKDPQFDMKKLQGLVVYPEMARKAGIEGTVRIRALVDKTGKISKAVVDDSDNKALDAAAIQAVLNYAIAVPAIMNNQPTTCWVTIPITFRLK